jgi:glycosyltransferase involved in cell wall biosynthesis
VLAALHQAVRATLVLPEAVSDLEYLPAGVETRFHPTPNTTWDQLLWEQRILPRIAQSTGADLLFLSGLRAPLASQVPCIISPTGLGHEFETPPIAPPKNRGVIERAREALGRSGLNASRAVLWPSDLPKPQSLPHIVTVPPLVHPAFQPGAPAPAHPGWAGFELPETYLLYHGSLDPTHVQKLLQAWSWAADSIGMDYPLLILAATQQEKLTADGLLQAAGWKESLRVLPAFHWPPAFGNLGWVAALYRRCSALLHLGTISPWGNPIRHALACGKPVVASATPWSEAVAGPAAYLAPADDPRLLGAALITICVEEALAQGLSQAALARAQAWSPEAYCQAFIDLF